MSKQSKTVVIGTGGTIAGTAASASDDVVYTAAQIGVQQLVAAVPALTGVALECEQVAQLDSKDMDFATWQHVAQRCAHHLARADVGGVVVTHGTDTLEETAYFLHRVLAPQDKPLVLTAAMRPATSSEADGPRNLLDAVTAARDAAAHGVLVTLAGLVWAGVELRKSHSLRLEAFDAGDAVPVAQVEQGTLRWSCEPPRAQALGLQRIARDAGRWPWVEIVYSDAGADGRVVNALLAQGVQGLVVAATGNGTLHQRLEAALLRALAAGVRVVRVSRCAAGGVIGEPGRLPHAGRLTPVQARVELLLDLLAG
jgi:L-asparaginase